MKTATHISRKSWNHLNGDPVVHSLFRMSPPFAGHEYVLASSVDGSVICETMLFAADADGDITEIANELACERRPRAGIAELTGYSLVINATPMRFR